jgi:hypothetical protein
MRSREALTLNMKIAMMVSHDRLDAPLALTFGKARWLLLHGSNSQVEFRRNDMLSGGSVAGAISASGCRNVIGAHLGGKAHDHLVADRRTGMRRDRNPSSASGAVAPAASATHTRIL